MDKKITYAQAIKEVEEILFRLNNDELDVDSLAVQVKRASELIAICKERLRKAEQEVEQILND